MATAAEYFLFSLAFIIFIFWSCRWMVHVISIIYGKWRLHFTPDITEEDIQGVSIIKPLTGTDPNLYNNLETFFNLKYPAYELLFCIDDETDLAIPIVRSLMVKYPKVDSKLLTGIKNVGSNGKINNMIKGYECVKYDFIMISDSGIRMAEDSIMDMMAAMRPDVGLVQQMPYAVDRLGFAAIYEKVYFGTQQSRSCLSAHAVGLNCTTGMSCIMRKEVLDDAGGMAAFGKYLAEDYFFAEAIRKRGYKTVICGKPALQNSGTYSINSFHKRMIRWAHLRSRMIPIFLIVEPLSECLLLGALSTWATYYLMNFNPFIFVACHVFIWLILDYLIMRIVENGPLQFSIVTFAAAWFLRELMSPYITFKSQCSRTIVWRHKKYRIRWGGLTEEI